MASSFEDQRPFLDLLLKFVSEYPEDRQTDELMIRIARMYVMKYLFNGVYNNLVSTDRLKSFGDHTKEYQDEMWSLAEKFMPQKDLTEQIYFIRAVMAVYWLLNN